MLFRRIQTKLSYAADFGVQSERAYATYEKLLQQEQLLPNSEKVDFLIATPITHAKIVSAHGRDFTICDKPMTTIRRCQVTCRGGSETNKVLL